MPWFGSAFGVVGLTDMIVPWFHGLLQFQSSLWLVGGLTEKLVENLPRVLPSSTRHLDFRSEDLLDHDIVSGER